MSKLFHDAITLKVKESMQHKPISIFYKGEKEDVEEIIEQWRVSQGWWRKANNTLQDLQSGGDFVSHPESDVKEGIPSRLEEIWQSGIDREYFRVRTARGIVCEIYRNLLTGAWHLQRIYD